MSARFEESHRAGQRVNADVNPFKAAIEKKGEIKLMAIISEVDHAYLASKLNSKIGMGVPKPYVKNLNLKEKVVVQRPGYKLEVPVTNNSKMRQVNYKIDK